MQKADVKTRKGAGLRGGGRVSGGTNTTLEAALALGDLGRKKREADPTSDARVGDHVPLRGKPSAGRPDQIRAAVKN
jgi:hypothetical protein